MPYAGQDFPPLALSETALITFTFTDLGSTETLAGANFLASVVFGDDPNVATVLDAAAPDVGPNFATQRISNLQPGVRYRIDCTAPTSLQNIYSLYAFQDGDLSDADVTVGVDSFLDVADFLTYCLNRGIGVSGYSLQQVSTALRRGTAYIVGRFDGRWRGVKAADRATQPLPWPRTNAYDSDGYPIDPTTVPNEVLSATAEAAQRELKNPGYLFPDLETWRTVRTETISPLSVTYESPTYGTRSPQVPAIDEILRPVLKSSNVLMRM